MLARLRDLEGPGVPACLQGSGDACSQYSPTIIEVPAAARALVVCRALLAGYLLDVWSHAGLPRLDIWGFAQTVAGTIFIGEAGI